MTYQSQQTQLSCPGLDFCIDIFMYMLPILLLTTAGCTEELEVSESICQYIWSPPSTIRMRTYFETLLLHAGEHVFICGRSRITVLHASPIRCSVTRKVWKHNIIILTDMCSVQNKVPDLKCPNFGCRRHNFLGIFFQKKIYIWPACLSTFRFHVISSKLQNRKHVNWIVVQPTMEPINDA